MAGKKKGAKKEKSKHGAELAEVKRIEQERLKQQQVEDELLRQKMAIEQAEERRKLEIVENDLRRTQLQESERYFDDFHSRIREILSASKKDQDWQRYMRCNGLPDVSQPGDLRKYNHMWKESEEQANRNETNWLLRTNEETVLTQDRTVPNLTVAHVRACQKNLGIAYAERIREVLHILNELQARILDPGELSDFILEDLITIRTELRVNLGAHIDQLAFKILSNIDRDMTLDSGSYRASYTFQSDILAIQLVTVRDIPQPQLTAKEKLKEETKHLEMEFDLLKINVNLPPAIKLCKSALRAIWLNFDHFSDYCPSFTMPKLPVYCQYPSTLAECGTQEWKKREEIKEMARVQMEAMQKEPGNQLDPGSTYIDVDKVYAENEETQVMLRRKFKGPDALKLRPSEINLRNHRIVGGIYGIDYLEQPKQNVKIGRVYLTTIYQNKLAKKAFYQSYKPPSPPQPGVRRLPEEIEAEIKQMEQNLDKLVLVNVQLPHSVIWFEPPLVCRWEYPEETDLHLEEDQQVPADVESTADETLPLEECICQGSSLSEKKSSKKLSQIKRIPDFNLLNIPAKIDMYEVMANYIMPRLPDGYRVKADLVDVQQQKEKRQRRISLMKYATPELKQRSKKRDSNIVTELLEPTGSPRELFPIMSYKKPFQVQICDALPNVDSLVPGGEDELDEFGRQSDRKDVYMLSSFLKDLDKLKYEQTPKFQAAMNESLSLNSPERIAARDQGEGGSGVDPDLRANVRKILEADAWDSRNSLGAGEPCKFCQEKANEEQQAIRRKQSSMGHWSSRDVHDVKFNEDKLTIQFRTGRLGFFGFAANRYSNLPFQTWELKPDTKNAHLVTFTLTAAVVGVDMSISEEGVRLNTIQGCSPTPFENILNQFMEFNALKAVLLASAVDVFPEDGSDATIYTEGSCEKHNVMESHLYDCMAAVALSHNFSWSRWNLLAGSRIAALLMREFVDNRKPLNHSTLLVTPLRTTVIECTEVSASFNTTPTAGMEYYADLHHLVMRHGHPSSLQKCSEMSLSLRQNVAQVLKSIRPLSFC